MYQVGEREGEGEGARAISTKKYRQKRDEERKLEKVPEGRPLIQYQYYMY